MCRPPSLPPLAGDRWGNSLFAQCRPEVHECGLPCAVPVEPFECKEEHLLFLLGERELMFDGPASGVSMSHGVGDPYCERVGGPRLGGSYRRQALDEPKRLQLGQPEHVVTEH
jgi:hypothetical protein